MATTNSNTNTSSLPTKTGQQQPSQQSNQTTVTPVTDRQIKSLLFFFVFI